MQYNYGVLAPASTGDASSDVKSFLSTLDAKAAASVQYIAAEATKGAAKAAKEEVVRLVVPALLLGLGIGWLVRGLSHK